MTAAYWFMAFLISFITTTLVMPLLIAILRKAKVGQVIQKEGPESHQSKAGTPAMGGLGIIIGLLASGWMVFSHRELPLLVPVVLLAFGYGLIGAVDDWLTIRPRNGKRGIGSKPKFLLQLIFAIAFVAWMVKIGHLNSSIGFGNGIKFDLGWVYPVFAVLFITGMANFINITDGLDGLAAGLMAILLAVIATIIFNYDVSFSHLMIALCGACLAFIWFNFNPARVFMGDTGSLFVGALIPAVAIATKIELFVIIAGMVFILDGLSSALQWAVFKYTRIRTGTGKRVFKMSPVHHHFELCGIPEQQVVVRFWLVGAFLGVVALLLFEIMRQY